MASVGSYGNTGGAVEVTNSNTSATIFNFNILIANTEYSQVLPADTKEFILKTRTNQNIKLAYNAGDSGALYLTIHKNTSYSDSNFYQAQTLYFQADQAGIIEIVAFKKI